MSEASIRAQISSAESQIDGCNAYIAELQEKIARLKEVKPIVSGVKNNLLNAEMELNGKIAMQERWRGDNKIAYDEAACDKIFVPYEKYYDGVDDILDSINDEITRMENEIYEQQGLIGRLRAWCNSLWNELANLFN